MASPINPPLVSPDRRSTSQNGFLAHRHLQPPYFFSLSVAKMRGCLKDTECCATDTVKRPATRFTKVAVGTESSDDEFGVLVDEGVFPNRYFFERRSACPQRYPATATRQLRSFETGRMVCPEDSRKVRSSAVACRRRYGRGNARVYFLSVKHSLSILINTFTTPVPEHTIVVTTSRGHLADRIIASLVLTAEVLVEPCVSRQRISLTVAAARAVGTAMEEGNRQGRQPLFRAHRQCLRFRAGPQTLGLGRVREPLLLCSEIFVSVTATARRADLLRWVGSPGHVSTGRHG